MSFKKYVNFKGEKDTGYDDIEQKIIRFHSNGPEKIVSFMLEKIFPFLEEQEINLAFVEGILKGTPSDPNVTNYYAFECPEPFMLLSHSAYTILPYRERVVPCLPLIHLTRHKRAYTGDESKNLGEGDIQDFVTIYLREHHPLENPREVVSQKLTLVHGNRKLVQESPQLEEQLDEIDYTLRDIIFYDPENILNSKVNFGLGTYYISGKIGHEYEDKNFIELFLSLTKLEFVKSYQPKDNRPLILLNN